MPKSPYIEKLCQMFEIFISSQLSISIYIPEIKNFLRRAFKIDKAAIFFLAIFHLWPSQSVISIGITKFKNRISKFNFWIVFKSLDFWSHCGNVIGPQNLVTHFAGIWSMHSVIIITDTRMNCFDYSKQKYQSELVHAQILKVDSPC